MIMPQVYVLDKVIRRLSETESSKVTSSLTKKLVIIDTKSRMVLEKKPFLSFGSQLDFFLVSNENDPQNIAKSSIRDFSISDFAADRSIGISIKYQISCSSGNEKKIALALFDDSTNTPEAVFEGKLINWLEDYARREISFGEFTTNYSQQLSDLRLYAEKEAREIGINLRLKLSLEFDESDRLKPFTVDSRDFPVLLNDFEEEVNFKFQANLAITENGKVNAILSYEKLGKLNDVLQEATRNYFRKNVRLYDFCYEFDNSVRSGLINYINQVLSSHGREIDGFFPKIANNIRMPEPDAIQCNISHEIQGYGVVVIKNVLEVEPNRQASGEYLREGIVKYKKAKISDIKEWFKDKLEKTIHRYLFDFSYVDVLLKYDSQSIKDQLEKDAQSIGYSIRLISTVPDLKPLKLRTEGFRFEADETFSTKQNSVKIKLGIDVRGKIENLESIKDILNDPQNDVNNLIAKEIIDSIKRILQKAEPSDFYAQEGLIYYLDDYSSKEAIKDKIAKSIEMSLKEKFGAISQISLQALNTDLLDLINELTRNAYHDFEIFVASVRDAGEPIRFTGSFQINGVAKDKWDVFASCKPDMHGVKEFLQNQLRYWFGSLSTGTLNYDTTQGLLKILGDANTLASKDIMNGFGLLITIHRFEHSDTKLKEEQRELELADKMRVLAIANEQIRHDSQLRIAETSISLNDMKHLNQELESVRGFLEDLSTQVGNEERKNKLRQREVELKDQLSNLMKENRKKTSEITSQHIRESIKLPTEESDFEAFVQSRANNSIAIEANDSVKSLPSDGETVNI